MSSEELSAASSARFAPRRRLSTLMLRRLLPQTNAGTLRIDLPDGERMELRADAAGPEASMSIKRWRCVWRLMFGGEVSFADSYIDGDWTTPDLPGMLEWAVCNEESLAPASRGSAVTRLMGRLAHRRRANTKRGSRRNIAAHYDLGNAFYEQWLDRGMTYSSALYTAPGQSLEDAQQAKIDRVIALLDIKGGENVLEIGFGWGGVLERLLTAHQCTATGLTLSTEQLAHTQDRLAEGGVAPRADLRLQDYRDVSGRFDRIVSIEMLEAVGEAYWPAFFAKVRDSLKDNGICVLQSITIAPDRFESYRNNPDFIQRYIFPGGMLPTDAIVRQQAERAGLTFVAQQSFGASYATTLQDWRRRFVAAWPAIEQLGFDSRFRRMWEYYLAYCEVGFSNKAIDVSLFKLRRI